MKLTPLLFAAILFLFIRLANDIPMGAVYFSHTWQFIVIELVGIIIGSYVGYNLAGKWVRFSVAHKLNPLAEYGAAIIFPVILALIIMGTSHDKPLTSELAALVIPLVITSLMSIWLYLTLKNNYLYKLYSESKLREQEALTAEKEAKLRLLHSQFHPHFLFNMLNTIYFTIDENNEKARTTVEHLSNLLRYQLYNTDGTVLIERELSALESYIEMCRIRFGEIIDITTTVECPDTDFEIYPYLLLPLVENAFKHSGGSPHIINVKLIIDNALLLFTVTNSLPTTPVWQDRIKKESPQDINQDSGLGLQNLRRRLELLYPDKYNLTISKTESTFTAHLKLQL
ncbi:MAG: histidine kinase [Muribaculaceae bacterium]|nr:histidine kinase [Muribaculaceae bacterium]